MCAVTVCNITENETWKLFGFNRSTFSFFLFSLLFYPVLNNSTTSVSSLVYWHLLNAIKIIFSRDSMCICKEKPVADHIWFNRQLMKSFLPSDWSSEGHLHLSVQNLLVDNNLWILSVAYHLVSSSPIGHILLIMCVWVILFLFFTSNGGGVGIICMCESMSGGGWSESICDN